MRFTGADGGVLAETDGCRKNRSWDVQIYWKAGTSEVAEGNYHGVIKVVRPSGSGKRRLFARRSEY